MARGLFVSHKIEERSYIAFVKKEIQYIVAQANFKPGRAGEIDIIVSELTSNVVKHAGRGELLYQLYWENDVSILELICLDRGPGMNNVPQMMRDGISTTNTLGQGLGAIERLSDVCSIYSLQQWGTLIYCQIASSGKDQYSPPRKGADTVAFSLPKPGELVCGDGYGVKRTAEATHIFLGDGLGHGPFAQEAVQAAISSFQQCREEDPAAILRAIHNDVRKTRGLVGTVAVLRHKSKTWEICGVGNILTQLYEGLSFRTCMPYNGIIGLNLPHTMKNQVLSAENKQHLIMCSDGINTRWDLNKYPGIFRYHPMILAGVLYKDFHRGHDDASVLISKVTL